MQNLVNIQIVFKKLQNLKVKLLNLNRVATINK